MADNFNKRIKKWLDGDFRRSDEAALRQTAREDAFVRDALDGFYGLPEDDHAARLEVLRKKIRGESPGAMQAEKNKSNWWAVAAALAFLLAAVWFFRTNDLGKSQVLTDAVQTERTNPKDEASDARTESVFSEKIENAPSQAQKSKAIPLPNPPKSANQQPQKPMPNSAPSSPTVAPDKRAFSKKKDQPRAENKEKIAQNSATNPTTTEWGVADDAVDLDAVSVVEETAQPVATRAKTQDIKEEVSAEEPTTFKTDRVQAPFVDSFDQSVGFGNSQPQNPAPLMGWDEFNRYLRVNARLTAEAVNNNISGTVRLRFTVAQTGEPVNITVLKSLGYGCDEEAKRLIEEGGLWQPGIHGQMTVDVPFNR